MINNSITLAAQIDVDGTDEGRARAHTLLDLLFDAAGVAPIEAVGAATPAHSTAGGATKDQPTELTPDQLRVVLTALATADEGAPLNAGERLMLKGIAESAPEPLAYDANKNLLGSGAKFGNVSSGLARRFSSRGYKLPYAPDAADTGYRMEPAIAAVVSEVLAATGA